MAVGFMGVHEASAAETCSGSYGGANSYIQKTNYFGSYVNEQNLNVTTCSLAFEWFGGGSTDEPPRGFVNETGYTIELSGTRNGPSDNRVLSFVNTKLDLFENKGTIIGTRGNGRLAMTMYGGSIKRFVNSGSFGNPNGGDGLYLSAANPVITELINTGTMSTAGYTIIVNRGSIDRIDNSGTIAASSSPVFIFNYPLARTTIIDNSGEIKRGTDPASTENIFTGLRGGPITKPIDFRNLQNGLVQGTINLGSANDLVTLYGGSTVTGNISGGTGTDGITLTGADGTHNLDITAFDTLTKTGTGTWSIAGTTTIESSISVEAGGLATTGDMTAPSVSIADGSSLLIGTGNTGGSLDADTVTNSGTLTFNRSDAYTFDAAIAGNGELVHAGPTTLTLSGNSTFSGQTTVSSGTLALTQNTSAGTSLIKLNDGTTLRADAAINLANQIAVSGSNVLDTQANAVTLNGAISGTGNLTKQGSGTSTLGGNSNLTGTLTIAQGSLATGVENALSGTTNLTLASGTSADLNNLDQTIGALSGSGNITLGTATLTTTSSTDTSFSGVISGDGGLTKSGAGTLTLSGANTYTGATTVSAGALATSGNDRLAATSSIEVATGAAVALGGNQTVGSFTGDGNINISNYTLTTTISTDSTFAGKLLGDGGTLIVDAAPESDRRMVLTGQSDFSGTVTINQGTLALDNAYALGFDTIVELTSGGVLEIDQPTLIGQLIEDGGKITGDRNNLYTTLVTTYSGALDTSIADVDDPTVGFYKAGVVKLAKDGVPGTTTIDALMAYTGTTKVKGGTLQLGINGTFNETSSLIMYTGGILDLNDKSQTFASIAGDGGEIKLGSGTLTDSGTEDSRYAGTITGTGSIAKDGSSTWILAGVNAYTGTTTINGGILALEQSDSVGNGAITIATGATLRADANLTLGNSVTLGDAGTISTQANDVTLSGVVSGTSLIKTGSGTLTLTNSNTYTGTTTVSGGTLALGQSASLGAGTLTLADQTTLQADATISSSNSVTLTGTGTIATQSNTVTLSGVVSGASGVLKKTGDGTLTLTGTNDYGGGTDLAGGTIILGNNAALGTGTLTASGSGVKLQASSSAVTLGNKVALNQDLIVDTNNQVVTLNGVMSGAGQLIKQGDDTLELNASNTYTGGTTLSVGTITLGVVDAAGTGKITMAAGTMLQAGAAMTVANAITFNGAATVSTRNNPVTLSGLIDGTGSLTMIGGNSLTLSSANTYTGGTSVIAGTLALGAGNSAGTGNMALSDGTTLQTNNAMTVANDIAITDTGAATIATQDKDVTISGVISGTSSNLSKTGTGTLTLSDSNTYTGLTTVSEGTLATSGDNKLAATSSIEIAAGANLTLGGDQTFSSFAGAGDIDLGDSVLTTTMAQSTTFSGSFTADHGSLVLDGNSSNLQTLTLTGESAFDGDVSVTNSTLELANTNLSALGIHSVIELDAATLLVSQDSVVGAVLLRNGSAINQTGGKELKTTLVVTEIGSINANLADLDFKGQTFAGGLLKITADTSELNKLAGYTGVTKIKEGELQVNGAGTFNPVSSLEMSAGGTLTFNNDATSQTFASLSGDGGTINLGADKLVINNTDNTTYAGIITGTNAQFEKTGTGTLVLSGANTYTGGTTISGGVLAAANANALGSGGLEFQNDATLRADIALTVTGAVSLNTAGTIDTQANNVTLSGQITGTDGVLTKLGNGVLTLSNASSDYSGGTVVEQGVLALEVSGAAGSGTITLADQAELRANAALTIANQIDLLGSSVAAIGSNDVDVTGIVTGSSIIKTGTGTLTLSNAENDFEGGIEITEGKLALANSGAAGTGSISLADSTTLQANADLDLGNAVTLAGTSTVDTNDKEVTLNGVVSGAGQLVKQGGSTLTLNASNTYTGGTTLSEGAVTLGVADAAGTGKITMATGTMLQAGAAMTVANAITLDGAANINTSGNPVTLSGVIDGTGSLKMIGGNTLTLSGANTYTGGTSVIAGTLALGTGNSASTGAITLSSGTALQTNNAMTVANDIAIADTATIATQANNVTLTGLISGDALTKTGTGTLTLDNASNSYSGGTTISAGTLALTQNSSAGTGSITIDSATLQAGADSLNIGNDIVLQSAGSQVATGDFDTTLSGVVSGAGGLTKSGLGTLTLDNKKNSYSGGSTISAGTLALRNNSAAGTGQIAIGDAVLKADGKGLNIANAIALNSSNSRVDTGSSRTTLSGLVSGSGQLVKSGSGVLTLSSANTYTGGTSVSAGVLALGTGTSAGGGRIALSSGTTLQANVAMALANAITVAGNSTIATGANAVTASGVVSGSGRLIKTGTGALTLSGANTYSGGTDLQDGTVVAASDTALGTGTLESTGSGVVLQAGKANLTLANAVTLSTDLIVDTAGELVLLNGDVTGNGRLIKRGTGILELAGNNSYIGGTTVEAGTLALDLDSAASTGEVIMAADTVVQADTSLTLDNVFKLRGPVVFNTQGFDLVMNNTISNNSVGQLIKTGSGTLTLNGANDYTGGTIVQQGTLALYGTLASAVEVQSGTTFGGTGTVTGDVSNAGTITPRLNGTRSTLTIVGNYVGENGTFASTLGGSSDAIVADQLAIQGAGNVASGSTTIAVSDPTGVLGKPTVGDGILLVGVTAGATSTSSAFTAPRIAAGAYEYTLVRGGESSSESWFLKADIDEPQPPVIITPEAAQREEVALYPSLPSLARQYLWSINGTLDDRRGAPDAIGQWSKQPIAWGRIIAQGNENKPGNVNNGPGLKSSDWGLQLGADLWRSDSTWGQWRVGPVATIGRSTGSAYNTTGSVKTGNVSLNAYSLGLNATVASHEGAYADLLLLGTRLTGVEANSPLGTSINTTGWAFSGSLEGGWRVPMTSKLAITPQAQVYVTTVNLNNAKDAYSLIEMPTQTTTVGRLGLKLSYDNITEHGQAQFWARASVFSALSGKDASTSFLNVAGTNPTTFQSAAPSTWMAIDAAVNVQASKNTSVQVGLGYQTSFNSQYQGVYGQVNVRFGF